MTPAMQLRLLRVLQEGEVRRVGESSAPQGGRAGHRRHQRRPGGATSSAGALPPGSLLPAQRVPDHAARRCATAPQDIPALAEHFLRLHRAAAAAVPGPSSRRRRSRCLRAYPFPGNVRELENEIERAVALADDGRPIGVEHLSERVRDGRAGRQRRPARSNEAIEELKRRMIEDALRECGSKTRAAERLGLTRQSLQQMLRRRSEP